MNPHWLPVASAEVGVAQLQAGQSNPRITQYHEGTNIVSGPLTASIGGGAIEGS
jgi:hypothetical protein